MDYDKPSTLSELEVYYQPQIDVSTNQIVAMEALLRWDSGQIRQN